MCRTCTHPHVHLVLPVVAVAVVTFIYDLGNLPMIVATDTTAGAPLAVTETRPVGSAALWSLHAWLGSAHGGSCGVLRPVSSGGSLSLSFRNPQGTRVTYGEQGGNPATWDADKVRGCLCDGMPQYSKVTNRGDVGYFVDFACQKRTCRDGCADGYGAGRGTMLLPLASA
jgi:hypothetical protein